MLPNPDRRQKQDIIAAANRIAKMLDLKPTPAHLMAWQEPRLPGDSNGECYPMIDVLERIVELVKAPKKGGRPKKIKQADAE